MGGLKEKEQGNSPINDKVPLLLSCRFRLALMCFLGLAMISNQRYNLSVAVVCMVNQTSLDLTHKEDTGPTHSSNGTGLSYFITQEFETQGEFAWNKSTQGLILGSFFWGYALTQLPGGWFAVNFGAKRVIGLAMIFSSFLTILSPVCARVHPYLIMSVRVGIGLFQGFIVPSLIGIWTFWAPLQEKTRLIGFTMSGVHIGNVLTFPISGLLCEYGFDGGWPTIFYFSGSLGLIWAVIWLIFIHDSPEKHRRISIIEKEYIQENVTVVKRERVPVPWLKVITSRPYWALLIAHSCSTWLIFGILVCLPIYIKEVLKFDIKKNGLMSAIPFLGLWIMTVLSGVTADALIRNKLLQTVNVRKISISITGMLIPAIICIVIAYIDSKHWIAAMVLITIAITLLGCLWGCGFVVNCADIAPKYCSLLFGISNTMTTVFGIFAPYYIGILTLNQTQQEWRVVFFIAAGITSFGAIIYLIFASGEDQKWTYSVKDEAIIEQVTTSDLINDKYVINNNSNPNVVHLLDQDQQIIAGNITNLGDSDLTKGYKVDYVREDTINNDGDVLSIRPAV